MGSEMLFHIGYQHHRCEKTQWYPHFTKADKTADNSVYIAEFCYATDKNRSQIKMKVKKANTHHTLKASIRHIKHSSKHKNLYISMEKIWLLNTYLQLTYTS